MPMPTSAATSATRSPGAPGSSYVYLDAEDYEFDDANAAGDDVTNMFTGNTDMWIVDAELKWTPVGDTQRRYLKLQGE